jgi:hypothetical protein
MGERTAEYVYTDEEGDNLKIRYTSRSCMCGGGCYSDTLEVEDTPDSGEFFSMDIDTPEIQWFLTELIERGCRLERDES